MSDKSQSQEPSARKAPTIPSDMKAFNKKLRLLEGEPQMALPLLT